MKFSIIIGTYNVAKQLPKTLHSILAQTYFDYEIIIVDGLSKDGTQKIIKTYENKLHGKLRWISEQDEGVYDAMNKGISMAKGDWLYFLGSDDELYDKNVLQDIHNEISNHPCDIIYGNVELGHTEKIYDGKFTKKKLMEQNISHQAIFFHKQVFKKIGNYNCRYEVLADWVFNMQWFCDITLICNYIDRTIARYGLGGFSDTAYDKNFYKDIDEILARYFQGDHKEVIKRIKKRSRSFIKNSQHMKLWAWNNKLKKAFFDLKKYINKRFL